jgi:hypothetical protein
VVAVVVVHQREEGRSWHKSRHILARDRATERLIVERVWSKYDTFMTEDEIFQKAILNKLNVHVELLPSCAELGYRCRKSRLSLQGCHSLL